jgi:small-conductance mechanosensitive channel
MFLRGIMKDKFNRKTRKLFIKSLYLLIVFVGIYFSLRYLSILNDYTIIIDRIFFVGCVLIIAFIVSNFLAIMISRWLQVKKRFEKTPKVLNLIISVVVYIIAILIILDYFKIEITPLIAALGVGGLALGLALQSTLSNFFAGLSIVSEKQINVGDYVEIKGIDIEGYVEDIAWRSTRIRTLPNNLVIVPNSKLADSVVMNNYLPKREMSVLVQCGVDYGSDLKKVEKITIDVAKKIQKTVPGAVKDFEPFIRFHTFSESNIDFTIILRVEKFVDKYLIKHEFIKALKERFDKEGIEISWPIMKVYDMNKKKKKR